MTSRNHKAFNNQIYAEAADWLVELRAGDADSASRKQFSDWLRTSPEHMRAYLELAAIWTEGRNLGAGHEIDEAVLAEAQASNVIALPETNATSRSTQSSGQSVRGWHDKASRMTWAASVLFAVLAAFGWYWYDTQVRGVYVTRVGEQYTVTLADGSVVKLNALSKIRVRFADSVRHVDLLRGQAFFQVAHDSARPFWVWADNTHVRAVGTQFDVYRKSANTTVSVVEGIVAIVPDLPPQALSAISAANAVSSSSLSSAVAATPGTHQRAHEMMVTAGEQLIVDSSAAYKPAVPDIAAATAWMQGQLIFKGTALRDVAAEFNRYNLRQLVIADQKLGDLKISGIFSSTDPAMLIRFLQSRTGIEVRKTQTEIMVLHKILPAG